MQSRLQKTLKDLKKADDSYVEDRVKMYEGLDLKDAGDDVVSGYKKESERDSGFDWKKGKKITKLLRKHFPRWIRLCTST